MLEKEKGKLNQYLNAYKDEASLPAFIEEQKIIVAALAGMVCDLEAAEEPDPELMELPDMKNNEQRKAFLENYRSWQYGSGSRTHRKYITGLTYRMGTASLSVNGCMNLGNGRKRIRHMNIF